MTIVVELLKEKGRKLMELREAINLLTEHEFDGTIAHEILENMEKEKVKEFTSSLNHLLLTDLKKLTTPELKEFLDDVHFTGLYINTLAVTNVLDYMHASRLTDILFEKEKTGFLLLAKRYEGEGGRTE